MEVPSIEVQNIGRPFNQTIDLVVQAKEVIRVEKCFAFMFTNIGDTNAKVNGMVIYAPTAPNTLGDSRTVSGHDKDEYTGRITVSFDLPVGANPQVEIVQLYYTD